MAFALLGNPKQGFFDSSGSPLSSGTLAVLDPSDDTNKASYPTAADADAATNANANPIVLDSRGEPPNGLFGLDGQSYKLVLKDSAAATVWTVTDILVPIDLPDARQTADESTAGITPTDFSYPQNNVRRYGALPTATGATNATAINNAILVATVSGGEVFVPAGDYTITTTLAMKVDVVLVGEGSWASLIDADGVDAVAFDFTTGFGSHGLRDIGLRGSNSTTKIGVSQGLTTLDDADELYGISLTRVYITDFNIGIKMRTARVCKIQDCWIQDVNSGIHLIGKDLVVYIIGNEIVKAAGNGTGTSTGLLLDDFDFTGGTGIIKPEGIQIISNQIFGFDTGFNNDFSVFVNFTHNDLSALIYGIEFTAANSQFNIVYNYIQVTGTAALSGVIGHGQAAAIETKIVIEKNQFNATSSVTGTVIGCTINDSDNSFQDHVDIIRNLFSGFLTNDIRVYSGGLTNVEGNRCFSTTPTNSIDFLQVGVARGPCYIEKNNCDGAIVFVAADVAGGTLVLGRNVINATTTVNPTLLENSEAVTATNVITADESGKTFYLNTAGGFTSTLPAPAIGLKYKFIVQTAPTTAYIITTNAGANILQGTFLDIVGELVAITDQDTLNFVASASLVGDSLEVESDGTNWHCTAFSKANGGITVAVT